jgi:hypothetical protein
LQAQVVVFLGFADPFHAEAVRRRLGALVGWSRKGDDLFDPCSNAQRASAIPVSVA